MVAKFRDWVPKVVPKTEAKFSGGSLNWCLSSLGAEKWVILARYKISLYSKHHPLLYMYNALP